MISANIVTKKGLFTVTGRPERKGETFSNVTLTGPDGKQYPVVTPGDKKEAGDALHRAYKAL